MRASSEARRAVRGSAGSGCAVGRRRVRPQRSADALLAILLILAAWEASTRLGGVPAYLLPPPSQVLARLVEDHRLILAATAVTAGEVLAGFALAIAVSVPLAAALRQHGIGWSDKARWEAAQALMREFGGLTRKVDDVATLYTNEFLPKP